ncbi:hypothetical protein EC973_004239 [Apophysomyces ossiformis]|uniref:Uncharacterized protein n=1 Tax=Apophysomyces ossiformis TaxID=679940 RepID=A0A8H7EUX5_9FUNG|nr:hypothetical protein EC973_004239 [Apophysomyces ossiformis]
MLSAIDAMRMVVLVDAFARIHLANDVTKAEVYFNFASYKSELFHAGVAAFQALRLNYHYRMARTNIDIGKHILNIPASNAPHTRFGQHSSSFDTVSIFTLRGRTNVAVGIITAILIDSNRRFHQSVGRGKSEENEVSLQRLVISCYVQFAGKNNNNISQECDDFFLCDMPGSGYVPCGTSARQSAFAPN